MLLSMCRCKIHRATVTQTELEYEGSLTLDPDLAESAGLLAGERVQVLNLNSGGRFETYVILGERGSGTVCLNGPAARLGTPGDRVIVLAYAWMSAEEARGFEPNIVLVDEKNRVVETRGPEKNR